MDTSRKFEEIKENNPALASGVSSPEAVFRAKINYQIQNFLYRKLSAEGEVADLARCISFNPTDYEMLSQWRKRISVLMEEIKFCKEQIWAYENNDNKRKIIPDRCL